MDVLFSNMNTNVLKEPLGFIRLLQLPMAILAFAATAGYSVRTVISYSGCPAGGSVTPITIYWGYSFDLTSLTIPANFCDASGTRYPFAVGTVSQSQFFVFTGVMSFLYLLLILAVYLLAWPKYENDKRFALGDFVVTAVFAVFWFIGSCAWASGVTTVKGQTEKEEILTRLRMPGDDGSYPCNVTVTSTNCAIQSQWNYASLNVSLIAGFACFGLWAANLWFIYKETVWYKARAEAAAPSVGPEGSPGVAGAAGGGRGFAGGQGTFR